MAKQNYSFEKRKKELERKRKKEEKILRKNEKSVVIDDKGDDSAPA